MAGDKISLNEPTKHLSKSDYDGEIDFPLRAEERIPEPQGDLADRAEADIEAEMLERIENIRRQLRGQSHS